MLRSPSPAAARARAADARWGEPKEATIATARAQLPFLNVDVLTIALAYCSAADRLRAARVDRHYAEASALAWG